MDSSNELQVIGEMKNKRIKFIDDEGNTNYIVFQKEAIEYYKRGSVDMKYKFQTNMTTKGYYSVSGNKFEFDIITKQIHLDDHVLEIKYDLYQGSDLVNETVIHIEYFEIEEE